MFHNTFQSGLLSVRNGHIKRINDEDIQSLIIEILGTNVSTTYISCPLDPKKTLGIKLPYLVMIVKNMKKYFTFEVQILDDKSVKRRFRASNFQSNTRVKPFICTMPMRLDEGWNQIQFNLADFTKRAYGTAYVETLRIQIHANCRIRRIYFADRLYSEDELPSEFKLYLPIKSGAQGAGSSPTSDDDPTIATVNFDVLRSERVHEQYLRNDIGCGLDSCRSCQSIEGHSLTNLTDQISSVVPSNHAIILDSSTIIRFHHLFDNLNFTNIIITQTVWEDVKKSNPPSYKSMYTLCYESPDRKTYVFMDDFHYETHLDRIIGENEEDRLTRSLVMCAKFYENHWKELPIIPVVICGTTVAKDRLKPQFENVFTLQEYVEGMKDNTDLLDKLAVYNAESENRGRILFPEYLTHDLIQDGIRNGKFKKATFQVSRENYTEAYVHGRINMNRAVNGDTVAVELLPESEWTCPQKVIRLRDVEEIEMKDAVDKEDDRDEEEIQPKSHDQRTKFHSTRILFAAAERLIPRIRIETRQAERLRGKRIIVAIDSWPRDSRYPMGHYVRSIGMVGDRETENEVLLLEHDVPHGPFSDAVYACLPEVPWHVPNESHRKDLRSFTICSVDPPGCTDIDDAFHCRQIAPDTAMDAEAAYRGTTVYLCDKRIDMLPELLSSDLCSLRENVDRLAFSVIWTLTSDADIIDIKFHKSLIRSSAALTYEQAQNRIDDPSLTDSVTMGLRTLLMLSKKLKAKRHANGALTLASSEIRFSIDSETKDPINVQEKRCWRRIAWLASLFSIFLSQVEEFMLLANISVAERITADFPDCALLRRHPIPPEENYKPIIDMAKAKGFKMNVESGKALSESLDKAVDPNNAMLNTLFRMLTTRCMTQAVYFSSGSLPTEHYVHFGLAAPIYTHFTSPIRRYADIMVHRLLASSISADSTFPEMLKSDLVTKLQTTLITGEIWIFQNLHKQAQYAGRASVSLNTLLYFKGRTESHDGFVMGIRKNGIQVFVPAYGFESIVVFPSGSNYQVTDDSLIAEGVEVRSFQRITVNLSLNETDVQHIRLDMKLVSPKIPGFSVDYILSAPEE
ncbi:Exosome complex exonuclease RRP44 [Dirofilaria immitis]|nr:Exosome complex exonuclease RRP44 [Dirofilaria immitis]